MRKRSAADNGGKCGRVGDQSSKSYVSEVVESVLILNSRLHVRQ
jgi:hypothetical protein